MSTYTLKAGTGQQPEDPPSGPDFIEDWSSYTDTEDLITGKPSYLRWSSAGDVGDRKITLDTSIAPDGYSQSVRFEYRLNDGADPESSFYFPDENWAAFVYPDDTFEIWTSVYMRWSDGFEWHFGKEPPPAAGYKQIHTQYHALATGWGGPNRFGLSWNGFPGNLLAQQGGGEFPDGNPTNWNNQYGVASTSFPNDFDDQSWHSFDQYIRVGQNGSTAINLPHVHRVWVDGVLEVESLAADGCGVRSITALDPFVNMNRTPTIETMYAWLGPVRIWVNGNDPGWS